MPSDTDTSVVESQMSPDTSTTPNKNHGKVPKRINKSEREKKKREHLNELFLVLANNLELPEQSTCKATILIEATRLVKDMLTQNKHLEEENNALLSESAYISVERNELKEENSALEAEIGKLRTEIKSRVSDMQLDLNQVPPENLSQEPVALHGTAHGPLVFPQGQTVNPLYLSDFYSNISDQVSSGHVCGVSKPHARYPTPADAWPAQILFNQPEVGKGTRDGYRDDNCCV